jgi:hypothetical protein
MCFLVRNVSLLYVANAAVGSENIGFVLRHIKFEQALWRKACQDLGVNIYLIADPGISAISQRVPFPSILQTSLGRTMLMLYSSFPVDVDWSIRKRLPLGGMSHGVHQLWIDRHNCHEIESRIVRP